MYAMHIKGKVKVEGTKIALEDFPELSFFYYNNGYVTYICEYESGWSVGKGLNLYEATKTTIKNMIKAENLKSLIAAKIKKHGQANNPYKEN